MRGSARAAALPQLFAPAATPYGCAVSIGRQHSSSGAYEAVQITGPAPRFYTPALIFATKESNGSNRPVATITPLSAALNLTYNDKHADSDCATVASDILTHSQYAGKVVLVCWRHGNVRALAEALGVSNAPKWQGSVFDRVWSIAFSNRAALADAQMLLYGDPAG